MRRPNEREAVAALGLSLLLVLLAQASVMLAWRATGRAEPPPAEWVSAAAVLVGLLTMWTPGPVPWLARHLPVALEGGARRHPIVSGMVALFALLALAQTARVSAFMVDDHLKRDALFPLGGGRSHMCLPAYVAAAELARAGDPNVYDESHYEAFETKALLVLPPLSSARGAGADAMHSHPVQIKDDVERDVLAALRCMCGCPRGPEDLLSTCACGFAEAQRAVVRKEIIAGMTKDQILAAYTTAHGASSLATLAASDPHTSVAHMQEYLFDPYEYPPPFLVVMRAMLAWTNDYRVLRAAWFFANALALLTFSYALARWIGGRAGLVAALLLPALWASTPYLEDLQSGQAHVLALALALAGMVAFEQRRERLGGALLGAAIVIKLAPGILLVYLVMRRQRRAVVATLAWVVAYGLLGLVVLGGAPYVAFARYQLPRLASGEAFSFFLGRPLLLAENLGVYAFPLKLRALGVPGMTLGAASTLKWIYGLLLVAGALLAARRDTGHRLDGAARWLALLNLAALSSPLAPSAYVTAGTVWLLTLLAPNARDYRGAVALLGAWLYLSVALPLGSESPDRLVVLDLTIAQLAVLGLNGWVALRGGARATSPRTSARRRGSGGVPGLPVTQDFGESVEQRGIEPLTSALRTQRSPS